ncbi:MAG: ankyrin repeat domain-containing protein [Planctomycetota bacterium]
MKRFHPFCIIASTALLLCGCGSKNEPATSKPEPAPPTPVQTVSTEQLAKKPTPLPVKKTKTATQAFFDAALNGDIQTVESELAAGVDVNAASLNGQNQTVLMLAAYNGHTELVEALIDRGGKVNHLDSVNRTALMYCSSGPFPGTVQLLIAKGANVNLVDNNEGWTALMFAAAEGLGPNVKILLENGADTAPKDIDGDTAASFAAKNGHQQVADMINAHK